MFFLRRPGGMSADFNTDWIVSFSDFVLFASSFGLSRGLESYVAGFDLESDGAVGSAISFCS